MLNIKSKVTIKILGYYFLNPKKREYINELSRILDVDPGNLDKKLKDLEKEGILDSELSGRQKYYYLNGKYPFLREVKKIYQSKYGLKERIKNILKDLKGLKEVYIFGSYAKGNFDEGSDIDVLLIGSHSSILAKKLILVLQDQLKREFNIISMTKKEFLEKKKDKDEFIEDIFKNNFIRVI